MEVEVKKEGKGGEGKRRERRGVEGRERDMTGGKMD